MSRQPHAVLIAIGVMLAALVLPAAGCASWTVRTDFDHHVDLMRYQTYAWQTPPAGSRAAAGYHTLPLRRVRAETDRELMARGLSPAPAGTTPGLLVSANVDERDREDRQDTAPEPGRPYPGRQVYDYTEGQVILQFIDVRTGNVVWRGAATRELDGPFLNAREARDAVHHLMAAHPPGPRG
jgi:hypothetical protein